MELDSENQVVNQYYKQVRRIAWQKEEVDTTVEDSKNFA